MPKRKSTVLSISRKKLILRYRTWPVIPDRNCWIMDLYSKISSHDPKIALRDVRRWCKAHPWILDGGVPHGMTGWEKHLPAAMNLSRVFIQRLPPVHQVVPAAPRIPSNQAQPHSSRASHSAPNLPPGGDDNDSRATGPVVIKREPSPTPTVLVRPTVSSPTDSEQIIPDSLSSGSPEGDEEDEEFFSPGRVYHFQEDGEDGAVTTSFHSRNAGLGPFGTADLTTPPPVIDFYGGVSSGARTPVNTGSLGGDQQFHTPQVLDAADSEGSGEVSSGGRTPAMNTSRVSGDLQYHTPMVSDAVDSEALEDCEVPSTSAGIAFASIRSPDQLIMFSPPHMDMDSTSFADETEYQEDRTVPERTEFQTDGELRYEDTVSLNTTPPLDLRSTSSSSHFYTPSQPIAGFSGGASSPGYNTGNTTAGLENAPLADKLKKFYEIRDALSNLKTAFKKHPGLNLFVSKARRMLRVWSRLQTHVVMPDDSMSSPLSMKTERGPGIHGLPWARSQSSMSEVSEFEDTEPEDNFGTEPEVDVTGLSDVDDVVVVLQNHGSINSITPRLHAPNFDNVEELPQLDRNVFIDLYTNISCINTICNLQDFRDILRSFRRVDLTHLFNSLRQIEIQIFTPDSD